MSLKTARRPRRQGLRWDNFAELHEQVGKVPLRRILMNPLPGEAKERDVLRLLEGPNKRLCELVNGVLVEKDMGYEESFLGMQVGFLIQRFLEDLKLGFVVGADAVVRLFPERIRIPDVSFYRWDRLPARRIPTEPIPDLYPDLAIEIISRNNTKSEMLKKRRDYFEVGVVSVWEVEPRTRTIAVYQSSDEATILRGTDVLVGEPVLPGFKLKVKELFKRLEAKP